MSTYREIIFMIQDELKLVSDDSFYTWDHMRFLVNKFRALILKKNYTDIKKPIPEGNYQLLCIDVEPYDSVPNAPCVDGFSLRSTRDIPDILEIGLPRIFPQGLFGNTITYVSIPRYENVGHNKYTQNFIYATVGPDNYLYLKSQNPQFKYLEHVKFYALFTDPEKASELQCEQNGTGCDILDQEFPLEDAFIPNLIEMVVRELAGFVYQPKDDRNNAADDLSELAAYVRRNMKNDLRKQLENNG